MDNSYNNFFLANYIKREKTQYDFEDKELFNKTITSFLFMHIILEGIYAYSYCTPMIYINLVSIGIYLIEYYFNATGHTIIMVWLAHFEIYFQIVLATYFMGYKCGFWLWLFPCVFSVVTPYFMPLYSKVQSFSANILVFIYIATFIALYGFHENGYLSTRFLASDSISAFLFYTNALIAFSVLIIYNTIYSVNIKQNAKQLNIMANTDYLTGLYNRQHIQKVLYEDNYKNIAIMDVDHFKNINDKYGHLLGDHVLTEIAKMISSRTEICAGRWGGEEFLLANKDLNYEDFCHTISIICDEISDQVFSYEGVDIKVTSSFGTATYTKDMTPYDLLKEADTRLYSAKQHGRNTVISA
ncbi:diguanylate cyclase (GGDEF) domain-containing protein [Butyrivibrio proteoclasticus]|uniref:Diguanylate cyclase (GGDEF) domain-containing protein n=1 Tax=Butyrivibrio proteoclasticus TaxID=43305 RepID=A0A1I5Q9P1_9FIRM|nr:GGDEF domain-containing protein [Butyrivibrio proteoclasticus]SFP42857.1 diguanylate cyclase (GGDEF) domain-containing protein [Butyrivibrio proteoclasticus]